MKNRMIYMARISKKSELIPMERPSLLPEDYADAGSAVIQFGRLSAAKGAKQLSDGGKAVISELLPLQVQYVNMRMAGLGLAETCKALSIDCAVPMLWEEEQGKDSVYMHCISAIRKKQALVLEDGMWDSATTDSRPSRDAMRLALIRSRMPEYRENSPTVTMPVQVNISIDREPYAIDVGSDSEAIDNEQ